MGTVLTSNNPQLPEHDKSATNPSRSHLCRVDRDRGVLCANADAHDESCGEQSLP